MSPIPAGDYAAHIVKSEFKETKAKNGHYLALQFKILEGEYKGRVLFSNLNLDNPNPVAVEIANKELNTICQAINLVGVEDSDELHQKPMTITVIIRKGDANYPDSNEIKGYKNINEFVGAEAVAPGEGVQPGVGTTQPGTGTTGETRQKLPWEK
jgi:hypothetical protein